MATYALTYATRAAFDTALASGDIYTLMQGVTSSQPSVAIAATITESGETISCGTNVMVDIKSVGPGDYIIYERTAQDVPANGVFEGRFFGIASKWIDNNRPNQPTQHIMIFKSGVLPSKYVVCGTVVKRYGNRIRLAGAPYQRTWSYPSSSGDYAWDVATILTTKFTLKKNGERTTNYNGSAVAVFPSQRYHESYYSAGNSSTMPILRSEWEAALSAGQETVTARGATVTLANYDFSFDRFLDLNWSPLFPAASGAYSDTNGKTNTKKIVDDFVANHGKTVTQADYAAGYCYNFTINAPSLLRGNWFLGTAPEIGELRALSHTLSTPLAWGSSKMWSSSQYGATAAWCVLDSGYTDYISKYNQFYCIPLADIIIST